VKGNDVADKDEKQGVGWDTKRPSGKSADAVEALDPTEPDSEIASQATDEVPAGGTSLAEKDSDEVADEPTGGQSFGYAPG